MMRKVLAVLLAALVLALIPLDIASARGGWGPGFGRGLGGFGARGSRKDGEKLRERTRTEDADALLRDAADNRRID